MYLLLKNNKKNNIIKYIKRKGEKMLKKLKKVVDIEIRTCYII